MTRIMAPLEQELAQVQAELQARMAARSDLAPFVKGEVWPDEVIPDVGQRNRVRIAPAKKDAVSAIVNVQAEQ